MPILDTSQPTRPRLIGLIIMATMTKSFIMVVLRDEPNMRPDVIHYHRDDMDCNHSTTACRSCMRTWRIDYKIVG